MRSPPRLGAVLSAVSLAVLAAQPACIVDDELPVCGDRPPTYLPCVTCDGDLGLVAIGPEHRRAYRIVFVPIGHADDEMSSFIEQSERLAADLRADPESIVGRRPELFDFVRASRPIRSDDGSWPCLEKSPRSSRYHLAVPAGVEGMLLEGMPGRTVLVEITRRGGGAANADRARELAADEQVSVRLAPDDDAHVLDHELGHAIVGLEDEYTEGDANGCYPDGIADLPPGAPQPFPNLSPHPDGRDWNGLVSGAREGGGTYYDACIFHPTDSCRMLHSRDERFCPVCNAAIHRALGRAARELGNPNMPPACVVTSTRDDETLHVRVVSWSYVPPLEVDVEEVHGRTKHVNRGIARQAPHLVDYRVDLPLEDLQFPVRILCTDGSPNVVVEKIDP
jgi:hypothetical protein